MGQNANRLRIHERLRLRSIQATGKVADLLYNPGTWEWSNFFEKATHPKRIRSGELIASKERVAIPFIPNDHIIVTVTGLTQIRDQVQNLIDPQAPFSVGISEMIKNITLC